MNAPSLDLVYGAIADPTRRAILSTLMRGDRTVGSLADDFPISFNGVSKHVKVLERAGLVVRRIDGREHWLTLQAAPLRSASRWLDGYKVLWERRLDALERILSEQPKATRARRSGGRR